MTTEQDLNGGTLEINIRRFRPELQMDPARVVVIIGRSGAGKSVLIADLLYRLARKSSIGLTMSATEDASGFFAKIVPKCTIYNSFDQSAVFELLNVLKKRRQRRQGLEQDIETMRRMGRVADQERLQRQLQERLAHERAFLIMDDIAYQSSIFNSDCMRSIFCNSRHYNVLVLISVQYSMQVPSLCRGNAAYIFAARETIVSNRKRLYEHYYGIFQNYHTFERVHAVATQGHDFMVCDSTVRSMDPCDCIFYYGATLRLPSFRLCDDKYWRFDQTSYDTEWEKRHDERKRLEMNGLVVKRK